MSFKVSKVLQFPQVALQNILQEESPIPEFKNLGGVLSDTRYVWQAKGPCLEVRNTKTGTKIGSWIFGYVLKDCNTNIVCVEEIQRLNGMLSLLAVGLECAISGGIICIFDVFSSKVVRAVQVKEKITSLHVVDSGSEVLNLPGPLRNFDGIISVGTEGGNVYLVDICRQICEEALNSTTVRDELYPCDLILLTHEDILEIEHYKEKSLRNGDHLAIHLNVVLNSSTHHFTLKGPKGDDRIFVNKNEVIISALYYCPQLTSLLVGFNFGAFQLWDLTTLNLIYTSAVYKDHVPITHFAIQEPTDDPRAFCYVWTLYSNTELFQSGLPKAIMYSICYESKEYHEGYGYLYQEFQSCSEKFHVKLGPLEKHRTGAKVKGGLCVALQSVYKGPFSKDVHLHDAHEDILALCSISWTVWFNEKETQTYMLVFDLNQWYKEQMPQFSNFSECSNYILNVNITNLLASARHKGGILLDVKIDSNTLRQFSSVQRLEEHFYPNALSFDLWTLRETDMVLLHNEGVQKALLNQIEAAGPLCLIRPSDFYHQIILLGLLPLFTETLQHIPVSTENQRETLLNVALEYQLVGWLCKCASEWANGSFASAGCSLDYLISWAFERAIILKTQCDKYCMPLFDYSHHRLDNNTSILLNSCIRQINNLSTFYLYALNKLPSFISNIELVIEQQTSLKMVSTYFEVLQWLVNVGLLPESHVSAYPRSDCAIRISAPYPVEQITKYYNDRRARLQMLVEETFISSDSLLFIDNLVNYKCGAELLQKQWQEDGGSGLYPPPSLQSLLRTYLVEGTDISHKHSLVIYLFLDLALALQSSVYEPIITHLIKFPAVFKVSSSIIKITQAFWQLDHGDFHTAMTLLLDPFVLGDDLQPWHHTIAMRALLSQKQCKYALMYMQVRKPPITDEKDVLTAISLFIANNMLDEAFYFKKLHQNSNEEKLLMHLFNECNKNASLHMLLYRCLDTNEEKTFFKYLKSIKNPSSDDLQVFYFLLRSRFVEAFDIHQNSKRNKVESQGLMGQRNATKTDQIVKIFKTLLPDINKSLVDVIRNERNNLWKEVARPTPLSVFVHNSNEQIQYKSTIIHAALAKARYTFNESIISNKTREIETEEIPFLRTPKVSGMNFRHLTPIIAPKVIEIDESGEELCPSPSKKLKLTPRPSTSSPTRNRSISVHTKMLTPIVKRRTPQKDDVLRSNNSSNITTPQSILKVRHGDIVSDKININETLPDFEDSSLRKSAWCPSPRKSLHRSLQRPHVQFDVAINLSSSVSDSNLHSVNDMSLENLTVDKSSSSKDTSVTISSKNSSTSNTEEVFYSPDTSLNDSSDKEENSSASQNVSNTLEAMETVEVERDSILEDGKSNLSIMQSPRARRSYKRSFGETLPVRSSPRTQKFPNKEDAIIELDIKQDNNDDKNSILDYRKEEKSESVLTDVSTPKIASGEQSPRLLPKVRGRKSLSRQVLEMNTFSKILPSPLDLSNTLVSKETSFSKVEKTVVTKKTQDTLEVSMSETKEVKNVSTAIDMSVNSHRHSSSNSVCKERVSERYADNDTSIGDNISFNRKVSDFLDDIKSKSSNRDLELNKSTTEKATLETSNLLRNKTKEATDVSTALDMSVTGDYSSTDHVCKWRESSDYTDSNISLGSNFSLSSPQLPDHLKISDSLIEYMRSRTSKPIFEQKTRLETDDQEGSRGSLNESIQVVDEETEDPKSAEENIEKRDEKELKPMEIYEDLSSGAEDIEEVLANSKLESKKPELYIPLTNCTNDDFNELEENVFETSGIAETRNKDETVQDHLEKPSTAASASSSYIQHLDSFCLPEAEKAFIEDSLKMETSALSIDSYNSEADRAFLLNQSQSLQQDDVIEIGSSSDEQDNSRDNHSDTSESKSSEKSDSEDARLNMSYERNIHIEENSGSLLDSENSQMSNNFIINENNDIEQIVIDDMELMNDNNEGEINVDSSSDEWMHNENQSSDENDERIEQSDDEEKSKDSSNNSRENKREEVEEVVILEVEIGKVIQNTNESHAGISVASKIEVASEHQEVVEIEAVGKHDIVQKSTRESNEFIQTEKLAFDDKTKCLLTNEENIVSKEEATVDESTNTILITSQTVNIKPSEDCESFSAIRGSAVKVITVDQSTNTTICTSGTENNNKTLSEDCESSNAVECNEVKARTTMEQSTNTTNFTSQIDDSVRNIDDSFVIMTRPRKRKVYYPKQSTSKVTAEDQAMSSASSNKTTDSDTVSNEIIVESEVRISSMKKTEEPLIKRITRRSSAMFSQTTSDIPGNLSDRDVSMGVSCDIMDRDLSKHKTYVSNILEDSIVKNTNDSVDVNVVTTDLCPEKAESDILENLSDPSVSMDVSCDIMERDFFNSTCRTPKRKTFVPDILEDITFIKSSDSDDVFTPGTRNRQSRSVTASPSRSERSLRQSRSEVRELNQSTPLKTTLKEGSRLRKTRSVSVDEVISLPRRRTLRSASIEENSEDRTENSKPTTKGRAASVSQLPIIKEEEKNKSKSKSLEAYATTRRLTRRQANLVKDIKTPSSVTAQDDSDVETALEVDTIDPIDPIKLLDKEPFHGPPDLEEEKIYEASSPSNSTASSINKPMKRARSTSAASDGSTSAPPTTPKRRTRQSSRHTDTSSPSGIRTRSRKQSETSSIKSEKSDPSTPPKRLRKTKENAESSSVASAPATTRSTRSRANSTSSVKTDASNSPKRKPRNRRLVSAKSDLPEILEEKNTETGESREKSTDKRPTRKKNK